MSATDATVFVVDDDAAVRRALRRLISAAGWRVEEFATGKAFLERCTPAERGCLVLDVRMPGMSGTDLHDRLCDGGIPLPVIYLTGHGDVPTSVRAMKRGAVDFLLKPIDEQILLQAIDAAVGQSDARLVQDRLHRVIEQRVAQLTVRERQVMEYVIGGCLNKQIAAALGISLKTVKVHRAHVMGKMQADALADLVHLCVLAGIPPQRL